MPHYMNNGSAAQQPLYGNGPGDTPRAINSSYAMPNHLSAFDPAFQFGSASSSQPPSPHSQAYRVSEVSSSYVQLPSYYTCLPSQRVHVQPQKYYTDITAARDALIEKAERARRDYDEATFHLRNLEPSSSTSFISLGRPNGNSDGFGLCDGHLRHKDSVYLGFPYAAQFGGERCHSHSFYTPSSSHTEEKQAQGLFGGIPCMAESFQCGQPH